MSTNIRKSVKGGPGRKRTECLWMNYPAEEAQ